METNPPVALAASTTGLPSVPPVLATSPVPLSLSIASVLARNQPREPWRSILCDLYYKGTPWEQERKKGFPDATSALAHFALRHVLSKGGDWSKTLLWTRKWSEARGSCLQTNQSFTVYPSIEGPMRIGLGQESTGIANMAWAIVTFTNRSATSKGVNVEVIEDERLMNAVRYIMSMGYLVDVWTSWDEDAWEEDRKVAFHQNRQLINNQLPEASKRSVHSWPGHRERRQRYEACMRHGLAGFTQSELTQLDELESIQQQAKRVDRTPPEDDYVLVGLVQNQDEKPAQGAKRPQAPVPDVVVVPDYRPLQISMRPRLHSTGLDNVKPAQTVQLDRSKMQHDDMKPVLTVQLPPHYTAAPGNAARSDDVKTAQGAQHSQSAIPKTLAPEGPELCGFLYHMEEIIAEDE